MVDSTLALMVRPPQIDYPNALLAASKLSAINTQGQLARYQLDEKLGEKNALAAYLEARKAGDPKALNSLQAHPDLYSKMLSIRGAESSLSAAAEQRKLLEAARSADRILGLPEPLQDAEYKRELDGFLAKGYLNAEQHEQWLGLTPEQRTKALNQIRMQGLPFKDRMALEKPTDKMREAEYAAKLPAGSAQRNLMLGLPKFEKDKGRLYRLNETGEAEDITPSGARREVDNLGGFADKKSKLSVESSYRKEYTKNIGDFITVRNASERVEASYEANSAAGDLSMIFNYMKILDPGSVVRESEFATAAASGSYGEQLKAAAEYILSGKRLSDEMRRDFRDTGRKLLERQKGNFQKLTDEYKRIAKRSGLDIQNIIPDYTSAYGAKRSGLDIQNNTSAYGGVPLEALEFLSKNRSDPENVSQFIKKYPDADITKRLLRELGDDGEF